LVAKCQTDFRDHFIVLIFFDILFFLIELYLNMTDEKVSEQNHNSSLLKKLSMPVQYQYDFGNHETLQSFFPSSTQRQIKTSSPALQIMNNKNPLTAFNYMSMFRPMSLDTSQSSINNHSESINAAPYSLEEPTVLKINIPIEMIVRNLPQQLSQQLTSPSQEQWTNRCNHPEHSWSATRTPCQTSSDWTAKPATSLIRKAQEVFFGTNTNNDRGDVTSNSIRRTDLASYDPRIANEKNKSIINHQQQTKNLQKSFQESAQHQPMMSRCSDTSPVSHPMRCQCGSTLYSPM
jgi:hypothetical protein